MFRRKFSASLAVAVLAVVFAAQPAAASVVHHESGIRGEWQTYDNPGLVCVYAVDTGKLAKIKVRPPTYMYGSHTNLTWVGYRFRVRVQNGDLRVVYKSPIQYRQASKTIAADPFRWRIWLAPAQVDPEGYWVQVHGIWYEPGSKTTGEGLAIHSYMHSRHRIGTQSYGTSYCSANY